jgi:hypothetical protein
MSDTKKVFEGIVSQIPEDSGVMFGAGNKTFTANDLLKEVQNETKLGKDLLHATEDLMHRTPSRTTHVVTVVFEDDLEPAFLSGLKVPFLKNFDYIDDLYTTTDSEGTVTFCVEFDIDVSTVVRGAQMEMEYFILGYACGSGLKYEVVLGGHC